MPALGAYEKHAQSEIHKFNLENYKNSYQVYTEKPIVLLSVFEHNANLIPWRETGANVVLIPMSEDGDVDYKSLQAELSKYRNYNSLKVGSFIAASNVTGTLFDTDRIAVMCHRAGFLACFDYAASGPYQHVNMNGPAPRSPPSFKALTPDE